jgi:hypothetical protein
MAGCLYPVILFALLSPAGWLQQPIVTSELTQTATVDRVERNTRMVVFRSQEGLPVQSVYVDPKVKAFDDLQPGDVVTVRYIESVIVQVRPDAKPSAPRETTEAARKAGAENVLQQFTAVVTVESVDPQASSVTYRTQDNRRVMRSVRDSRLLEGVRPGDRVEITLTRERAVSVERGRLKP